MNIFLAAIISLVSGVAAVVFSYFFVPRLYLWIVEIIEDIKEKKMKIKQGPGLEEIYKTFLCLLYDDEKAKAALLYPDFHPDFVKWMKSINPEWSDDARIKE